MIDKMIGGFRILDEIKGGSGGQGRVFKAVCENRPFDGIEPGTVVALKVMSAHDEDVSTLTKKCKQLTSHFEQLVHPNVVRYYGCFVAALGVIRAIEVQEWLEGETLKQRLARNPHGLDTDETLRVTDAALAGLEYMAKNGIVHRDVKPSNIFLCLDAGGVITGVKLIDFLWAEKSMLTGGSFDTFDYDYMAPELTRSRGDERSDVFSVGVVVHETITGRTPYQCSEGGSGRAGHAFLSRWARLHVDGTNPIRISPRAKRLLDHLDEVLAKALAPLPEDRYESFMAFRAGLKTIRYRDLKNGATVYRLLQFIGEGGFGEVFKARQLESGKIVAIKHMLKVSYAKRLYREAKILARFKDSCFVRFVDFFKADHVGGCEAFLVMDFLPGMPGSSLRDAIKRADGSPLPLRETLLAFARFAHGLSVLHSNGIIHRDIKPFNLYYPEGQPERVAIMDLAIARDVSGTQTFGPVPGTLDYMPPEVVLTDNRGGPGMDIYALGLSLYEALTGKTAYPRLPQGAAAITAFLARANIKAMPDLSDQIVVSNAPLHELLVQMTHPELSQRLVDAKEVERRLSELAAAVKEQDLSEPRCQHTVSPYKNCGNVKETGTISLDEVPTDDAATHDPASDVEAGGWQIEVYGNKYVFSTGSTVEIGKDRESDIVLRGNDTLGCRIFMYCDSNIFSISNNGRMDVSVANTKVGVGQRVSVSCLFTPCVIRVGFNTEMRIAPITSWKITADGFDCRRVIGRGGQSVVFEAICTKQILDGIRVGDKVALKVLKRRMVDGDLSRFNGLIKKLSACGSRIVHHYGCLRVRNGDVPMTAIAMELLDGESLYMRLKRHPHGLDVDEAVRIMDGIVDALSYIHKEGVSHKDVKTSNVFLCRDGYVKLLDFALARAAAEKEAEMSSDWTLAAASPDFIGDVQSDIYSLALVFREMLRGQAGNNKKPHVAWDGQGNHPESTFEDRVADVDELVPGASKIIEQGLSLGNKSHTSFAELISALDGAEIRFPVYEYGNHRYMRLTYERCSGCSGNGIAYGKILDYDTGEVLKWKTFDVVSGCRYVRNEIQAGLLSQIQDDSLKWGVEAAFLIGKGKARQWMLIYTHGIDDPANTPRYQGKALWGMDRPHAVMSPLRRQIPIADALVAFSRYARALSILHDSGVDVVDVAPDILLYEDGKPSSSAITCRRYGCWCDGGAGPVPSAITWRDWSGVWGSCEEFYRSFYRLPDGTSCDAFALGLCLYEVITGQRGYLNPLMDEHGHITDKGKLSIDFDHPILAKCADVSDIIRRMTELDECRRLKSMRRIEESLRELAVRYRLKDSRGESNNMMTTNVESGKAGEMEFSMRYSEGGWFRRVERKSHSKSVLNFLDFLRTKFLRPRTSLENLPRSFKARFAHLQMVSDGDVRGRRMEMPSPENLTADYDSFTSECDYREAPEPLS